jgi:hypothetical protein
MLSTVDDLPGGNWRRSRKNEFHSVIGGAPTFDSFSEYEKRVPIGRLVPMDVTTNLFHGAVVGTLVVVNFGLGSVAVYLIAKYSGWMWVCLVPMAGLGAMTVTYLSGMGLAKHLLEQVESVFRDDEQPQAEPSAAQPVPLEIKHTDATGKVIKRTRPTLPDGVTTEMLGEWCDAVYSGIRGLGESEWTGNNGLFTGAQYREFKKFLVSQGIIFKNGTARNSEYKLAPSARPSLPYLAEQLKNSTQAQPTNERTNNYEFIEGE